MVNLIRRAADWLKAHPYVALYVVGFVALAATAASAASLDDLVGGPGCTIAKGIGTKTAAGMTGLSLIGVLVGAFGFGEDGREFIKKFAWAIIPGVILMNVPTILLLFFSGGCG